MDMKNSRSNALAKAGIVTGIFFVLGLLFDYFFYGKIPGISFPFYVVLVIAGLFFIANFLKKKINKKILLHLVLHIFIPSEKKKVKLPHSKIVKTIRLGI